jgi:hypothetical protein
MPTKIQNVRKKTMKKLVFILLLALMAAGSVFAKDNLAILPFSGGDEGEGETVAELFSFEPALTAAFTPIPRTSINRAIRGEQSFQYMGGMTDPDTAVAVGKQLGAQYVVYGIIAALGNQKLLVIAILKIDEMRQIAGDVATYGRIEDVQDELSGMARNIAAAAAALSAEKTKLPRLALPPVELLGGADRPEADALAQILAANIIRGGKYAVYPRTESVDKIQQEYANQFREAAEANLPTVGKGANPELVLSVTARRLGTRNMFNAAVINLKTGAQEAGESANYQSLDDGMKAMRELALTLAWQRHGTVSDADSFTYTVDAINKDKAGGEYTITLNGSFAVGAVTFEAASVPKTITLKGDGGVRTITNSRDGRFFTVWEGVTLVLENNVTLDNNKKASQIVVVYGALVMKNGATLRNSTKCGVSVFGYFTMNGGTITGNSALFGGGVYVSSGYFTMSGGTITGNSARYDGGGVYVSDGSVTMNGGTITGNSADRDGGGVLVSGGSFTMSGGTITGNSAGTDGGGVYVNSSGRFTRKGGTVSGNKAGKKGDDVYQDR